MTSRGALWACAGITRGFTPALADATTGASVRGEAAPGQISTVFESASGVLTVSTVVRGWRYPSGYPGTEPTLEFQGWLARRDWIKRFTAAARPGAYLRVIEPGEIRVGDPVVIEHRPDHDVTIALTFRALTTAPDLLPRLAAAGALPQDIKDVARKRAS